MIVFTVWGIPQSQGSAKAFMPKGWKRPIITSTNSKLKGWRQCVAEAASQELNRLGHEGQTVAIETGPVELRLHFRMPRPKKYKSAQVNLPCAVSPDVDKLCRSACDAITGVLVEDDRLIVRIIAEKFIAEDGQPPCVTIALMPFNVINTEVQPAALDGCVRLVGVQ